MVRFSWLRFLGQLRKHLYVALIFGIDLHILIVSLLVLKKVYLFGVYRYINV